MQIYIKEWPNHTATIISGNGQLIWTFSSIDEARQACGEWHNLVDGEPILVSEDRLPIEATPNAA